MLSNSDSSWNPLRFLKFLNLVLLEQKLIESDAGLEEKESNFGCGFIWILSMWKVVEVFSVYVCIFVCVCVYVCLWECVCEFVCVWVRERGGGVIRNEVRDVWKERKCVTGPSHGVKVKTLETGNWRGERFNNWSFHFVECEWKENAIEQYLF